LTAATRRKGLNWEGEALPEVIHMVSVGWVERIEAHRHVGKSGDLPGEPRKLALRVKAPAEFRYSPERKSLSLPVELMIAPPVPPAYNPPILDMGRKLR
jgi:hypothetical protein